MIDSLTMGSIYVALGLTMILPTVLAVYGFVKKRLSANRFLYGILLFFVLRTLVLVPLATLLSVTPMLSDLLANAFFAASITALLITVVDVFGKRIGYKFLLKEPIGTTDILSIAAGQGFAEVVFTLGLNILNNLLMANLVNDGTIYSALAESYTKVEIEGMVTDLIATKSEVYLFLAIGGICILIMHLLVGFLVMRAIKYSDNRYLLFSITLLLIFNAMTYSLKLLSYPLTIVATVAFTGAAAVLFYKYKLFDLNQSIEVSE